MILAMAGKSIALLGDEMTVHTPLQEPMIECPLQRNVARFSSSSGFRRFDHRLYRPYCRPQLTKLM
jgi:hypothetical protein